MIALIDLDEGVRMVGEVDGVEDDEIEIGMRLLCSEARVQWHKVRAGMVAAEDWGRIVEAAEGRAGEIEDAALEDAERLRAEGARAAEEVRKAAEGFRDQTEHKARAMLEDAREAAEALWQETERKRVAVEGETRRLEALRERTHEQLARMYGHLESVLGEVRRGIGGAEDAAEEAGPA